METKQFRHALLTSVLKTLFGNPDEALLRPIESAIEWVHLKKGELLFRQGDLGDSLYILVNGRLRAATDTGTGTEKVLGDIIRAETVGEMALFTEETRSASVYAIRDSELARLSKADFDSIKEVHPHILVPITNVIIKRLKRANVSESGVLGIKNIAVYPTSPGLALSGFLDRLVKAVSAHCKVSLLSGKRVDQELGIAGISEAAVGTPEEVQLLRWLEEQEDASDLLLFECDDRETDWTRRCIRQSDRIIIVGTCNGDPEPSNFENRLIHQDEEFYAPEKNLVILYQNRTTLPTDTDRWLRNRTVRDHYHICLNSNADMERLARILTNRSIGLVLGGGGSRAYAHIGVLMALEEARIPVDMVGGTSMGAVIASQVAMGKSIEEIVNLQKMINAKVKPFQEYNLPIISIYGRKRLTAAMKEYYNDLRIEDLWLGAFFMSTNLTRAESIVHRTGSLRKAVLASMSLPGVLPPVVDNNELLVDGCVLNNLPGDVMKEINNGRTIVVNVNPKDDLVLSQSFEELPTPLQIIRSRANPFRKGYQVPGIMKIMMRSNLLHTIHQEAGIAERADFYLQPPVEDFSIMDLKSIDKIIELGYGYAVREIRNWQL